jgi:uncharacterized protein YecE (DUF72 family)
MELRIGTSGWHYKHWHGRYYPASVSPQKYLAFYTRDFDSVEINNSFYRFPSEHVVDQWRLGTPDDFCFAVKGSRYITHNKKLADPENTLGNFIQIVTRLGEKLGPILFQLPPHWHCNLERLNTFLYALPSGHRFSFELRDPSWHTTEVYRSLRRHNAAFCLYDLAGFQTPAELTADFVYIRLHGPCGKYQGEYSPTALKEWARRLKRWSTRLAAAYVYFDNDEAARAVTNAKELKRLMAS